MPELLSAYWPYLLIAFAIGLAVAWFAFAANRKTSIKRDSNAKKDVLDEGAERAGRNDALINAAPAASAGVAGAEITEPATQRAAPEPNSGDDLTRIKGLGPKIAVMLGEQGITSFAQIAAWSEEDIDRVDASLGRFEGRIRRDSWVQQAMLLAAGDETGFSSQFGNN